MSDNPETIAAIIAEMRAARNAVSDTTLLPNDWLTQWADRIEAAYKREHADWHAETESAKDARNRVACRMRSEFAAKCRNCTDRAPGNAAAMRAVLHDVDAYLGNIIPTRRENELRKAAREALAAPARNCDVGTAEEQAHRFHAFCSDNTSEIEGMCNSTCPCIDCGDKCHCLCVWSQMPFAPAEGGKE